MIAGDCRRDGECGSDRDAQGQGPTNGDRDLTNGKRNMYRSRPSTTTTTTARVRT
jgi:hypothetical protein